MNSKDYKAVVDYFPEAYIPSMQERQAFNILAASFVKFIEKEYRKENLLEIYNYAEVMDIINKTIDQLKEE